MKKEKIYPLQTDLPSDYADRMGILYTSMVTKDHKKKNGQFFTPLEISRFMGELTYIKQQNIKILDPGCGTAVLSCALIESLVSKYRVKKIELTLYETDSSIISYTKEVILFLKTWLKVKKIEFVFEIINEDFVLANADVLNDASDTLFGKVTFKKYDIIISNPPYFKLSKEDLRTKAAFRIVNGQPNIYAIFMGISTKLLNNTGQLIFITPRSFASGSYFKTFRDYFLTNVNIQQIHLFVSRKNTFNRDSVLQETMILKAIPNHLHSDNKIIISSSLGLQDLNNTEKRSYFINELIDPNSKEKIIHLPINDYEQQIVSLFKSWGRKLKDYNIQISTGPVVGFRATKFIKETYENSTKILVPLYWLHNVLKMKTEWPINKSGKGQYIEVCPESKSLLVPNKNYILLRRFSSKDDKSRLVAAPYFINPLSSEYIGVENKVNYIYRPKGNLDRDEVLGLSALLNSKLFDTYFRTFNGNVNVSATELREMPLPALEIIKEIGNKLLLNNKFSQTEIDEIISQSFSISNLSTI